jgi:hypothetical protein
MAAGIAGGLVDDDDKTKYGEIEKKSKTIGDELYRLETQQTTDENSSGDKVPVKKKRKVIDLTMLEEIKQLNGLIDGFLEVVTVGNAISS